MAEIKKYLDTTALETLVGQIKSEDAKVLAAAKKYTDDAGALYDTAGAAATAETNAKAYTDELANGQVKTNKEAIATLNGDANTVGSVAKAIADAKTVIDGDIDAVEAKADKNAEDIASINHETTGILAQAKGYTDTEVAKVQGEVDTLEGVVEDLEGYVGEIPEGYTQETVIAYINKKAEETLAAASGNSSETAASVKGQLDTYKVENDARVAAVEEDVEGLSAAIDTEKERAEGKEAELAASIKAISDDYLKAADKTELQGNIDTVAGAVERLTNGVSAEEIDGVNDLIAYVNEHGATVTGLQNGIDANAQAIEGVTGRMTTAEGKITALEEASATHATQTALAEAVTALEGADTALSGRITTLENKFTGEGSVEDMIADAKQEAIDAAASAADTKDEAVLAAAKKYADDEDALIEARVATLETASATHALASDLTALDGRVTTAEGEIDTLQTEMDAVEAKAAANETAISGLNTTVGTKAAQADLEAAVARVAQNETDISALKEASATHALTADLNAAVERIAANETAIAENKSAIGAFTAITSDEVNALFA